MKRIGRSVVTAMATAAALTVLGGTPSFAATATHGTEGSKATHAKHSCKAGAGKCQHKQHAKHTAPKAAGEKAAAPTTAQ